MRTSEIMLSRARLSETRLSAAVMLWWVVPATLLLATVLSPSGVRRAVMMRVYAAFGRLPRGVRRRIVRSVSPKFTVGAVCLVYRGDGRVLLVRHSYHRRWGTAGGLAKRREPPRMAAVREAREEVGLEVELVGEPAVVVEPVLRRVDVVYEARPVEGVDPDTARPTSAEIVEVGWFAADALPDISSETAMALAALRRRGLEPGPGREPPG